MPEVDPVVLELRAENGKYLAALRQSTTAVDAALGRQQKQVQSLENQFRKSSTAISGQLRTLAAGFAGAFSVRELGSVIDSFTRLQNNLRVAGLEGQQLASVQQQLLDLSTKYGSSIEGLSSVFLKASLAQQSLGASTEDIIRLNEVVAASLKVTGTSATEAQGALLQLGQALGSGVVRAEEFNSILEGAFPLAQAAARGIEGFAGDVAKLRIAIANGDITSKQFFEGVLRGGVDTLNQAEKATMTLSGAFTALGSQFTVYIGEGAKANGITQALSSAIVTMADNLDRIIPALSALVALIGVRYVAGLARSLAANVAEALATAKKTIAIEAESAALAKNAGMMNARTVATAAGTAATVGFTGAIKASGAALLTAFGGPVGLAITGVSAALVGLVVAAKDTAQSVSDLEQELVESSARLADAEKQARAAGVDIENLGGATDDASSSMSTFTGAVWASVDAMIEAAKRAKELTLAKIALSTAEANQTIAELQPRVSLLERAGERRRAVDRFFGVQSASEEQALGGAAKAQLDIDRARVRLAKEIVANNERAAKAIQANSNYVDPAGGGSGSTGGSSGGAGAGGKKRKGRERKQDDALEAIHQENQRLRDAIMDEANARLQLATNADERADIEFELLGLERASEQAALDEALRKKDIGKQEYDARKDILDKLYGQAQTESDANDILVQANNSLYAKMIKRRQAEQEDRDAAELARLEHGLRQDALRYEYDMATNRADRLRLAKQMIDGDIEARRVQLESIAANKALSDAERERARIALAALETERKRGYGAAEQDHMSPLEAYRKEISDSTSNMNDQYESIAVSGLKSLNDGLTDAIVNSKSLGDVFKNVAKQIIADLIRIAIQQTIVNALMSAIPGFGGFGGGGGGSIGFGGRASGGHVNAGQVYRVNEAKQEFFQPAHSGQIIPLGEMNAKINKSSAQGGGTSVVQLQLSGDLDARIAQVSGPIAVEVVRVNTPAIAQLGAAEAQRNMTRPSMGRSF